MIIKPFIYFYILISLHTIAGRSNNETSQPHTPPREYSKFGKAVVIVPPYYSSQQNRVKIGRVEKHHINKGPVRTTSESETKSKLDRYKRICKEHEKKIGYLSSKLEKEQKTNLEAQQQLFKFITAGITPHTAFRLKQELSDAKHLTDDLTNRLNIVTQKNDQLSLRYSSLEKYYEDLLKDNDATKKENHSLLIQVGSLSEKMQHLEEESKILQEQLFPSLYIKKSTIVNAGKGLFAGTNIKEGTILGEYTGRRVYRLKIPSTGKYVVWRTKPDRSPEYLTSDSHTIWGVLEGSENGIEIGTDANYPKNRTDKTIFSFINHSGKHNSIVGITGNRDRKWIQAYHDIKKDEEIFWDYNDGNYQSFNGSEIPCQDHIHTDATKYVWYDPDQKKVHIKDEFKQPNASANGSKWKSKY